MAAATPTASTADVDDLLQRKSELLAACVSSPRFAQRRRRLQSWQAARLADTYRDLSQVVAPRRGSGLLLEGFVWPAGSDSPR